MQIKLTYKLKKKSKENTTRFTANSVKWKKRFLNKQNKYKV